MAKSIPAKAKASIKPPTKFAFTRQNLKKTMAQWDRIGGEAALSDTRCPGLRIRRRTQSWQAELNKRVAGKLYRKTLRPINDAKDIDLDALRLECNTMLAELVSGRYADEGKRAEQDSLLTITVDQALALHFDVSTTRPRESTKTDYARKLANFKKGLGRRKIADVTAMQLRLAYNDLLARVKPASAASYSRTVKAIWSSWAWACGDPSLNVALDAFRDGSGKSVLKATKPKKRRLQPSQFPSYFVAIAELRETKGITLSATVDAVELLLLTGCRKSEIFLLNSNEVGCDIDGFITLAPERLKTGRFSEDSWHKPLGPRALAIVERRQELAGDDGILFNSWMKPGTPINDARKTMKAIASLSGVSLSAHDLRRTYEDVCELAGIGAYIQRLLTGHSGGDTHDSYKGNAEDEAVQSALREAADKVEAKILELGGVA